MHKLTERMNSPRKSTRDLSLNIFVTLALATLFTLINPNFADQYNLVSIGQNLAPYAMLALGVMIPASMGGTDLSIGAVCIASAVVAGKLYGLGLPLIAAIPVMLIVGSLAGFINGLLIARYRLQPFIATLGMMMFIRGISAIFANTATVLFPSGTWYNYIFSNFNGLPVSFLWVIIFALIFYFMYRKTKLGRYFVSIGSNEKSTAIAGVDTVKYKIIGYTIAGFMAGVAAIFWSASFATVTVATGNGMELDALASVYIGGTSVTGGLANVFGSVIGSIMLVVIRSGLNFSLAKMNISVNSTYVTYVISGIIVVVAVMAEKYKDKNNAKRSVSTGALGKNITRSVCVLLSVAMGVFLVMTGISSRNSDSPSESKTICLVMKSSSGDFWDAVQAGANAAGDELGYTVICRGCESEDASELPKQREIISTLLAENPAGMAVSAIADGLTDLVEEAYDRSVPVIQYDSGLRSADTEAISASDKNPLLSYVKADNYANAAVVAEYVYEAIKEDIAASEDYVVGIIQHENSETSALRTQGFQEKLMSLAEAEPSTAGKCRVLVQVKPSNKNNSYKEALEYLYENDVRMVFGTSILVTEQCYDAVSASAGKYDGLKFAGYDTGERATEWIKSDNKAQLLGVVSQNPYQLGYLTIETLVKISQGETVDNEIIVPGKWYCPDNISELEGN